MIRNTGDDASARTTRDDTPTAGTTSGAETTGRMTGIHNTDERREESVERVESVETVRPTDRSHGVRPAKTSAAAAFALVFGLAALFCALTAILAPAAVVFGLIGILLGIAGKKMADRPGVTGKGVATGGLVTAVLGLLLGGAVIAGAAVLVNDEQRLDQLEEFIDDRRADLPTGGELREELPN